MSNDKNQIQEKLASWAEGTVNVYNPIAETLNKESSNEKWGYYTQTPLSLVSKSPDLLILGINPGSAGGKESMSGEELLKGNPCFENKDKKDVLSDKDYVIYVMKEKNDGDKNRNGWALWHRLNNMLKNTSKSELLENIDNFVLSNMIFFGTAKEYQIPKIDKEKCAKQTLKLIDYLEPKVVILLGKQSRDLYNRITDKGKLEVLVPNSIYHCMYDKSHILAIKHTAYHYSYDEIVVVGKTIGFVLDHHEEAINKETIFSSYIKNDIIRFEEGQKTKQPKKKLKVNSAKVIKLLTSNPCFQLTMVKKDHYYLSENLVIRITNADNGYLAIRHKNYDVQYPNSKYVFTEEYRNFLNTEKQGWKCDNYWLAKKHINDFGNDENEIVKNIISELNDIIEFVR